MNIEEQEDKIEVAIIVTLESVTEPITSSRLLQWSMIAVPDAWISWDAFITILTSLVERKKISVSEDGLYCLRTEQQNVLESLGL